MPLTELPQAKAFLNYGSQSTFAFVWALSGHAVIAAEGLSSDIAVLDSINAAVLAPTVLFFRTTPAPRT